MPFRSKKQMKACFASNGFNGKVNCDEWAKATDMKTLKQDGGPFEEEDNKFNTAPAYLRPKPDYGPMGPTYTQPNYGAIGPVQPSTTYTGAVGSDCPGGLIWSEELQTCVENNGYTPVQKNIPRTDMSTPVTGPGTGVNPQGAPIAPPKKPVWDPTNFLRGAQTGLAWLGNKMEMNRQDQYTREQIAHLQQPNAQPVDNFQPNYYNLYAKMGGKIKKQLGGDIKDYYTQYINSPMYKKMNEGKQDFSKERLNQVSKLNSQLVPQSQIADNFREKNPGVPVNNSQMLGYYDFNTNNVNLNNKRNFDPIRPIVEAHEWSHGTDAGGKYIPQQDQTALKSEDPSFLPTEGRALLNQARFEAKQSGVYDPFTQPFKADYLRGKSGMGLKALQKQYSDEQITNLMNSVSSADQPNLPMAQDGGRAPIQVTNPNDPRLRAYNDSSTLYNASVQMKKLLTNGKTYQQNKPEIDKNLHSVDKVAPYMMPTHTEDLGDTLDYGTRKVNWFQKPVQPVVYQPQQKGNYNDSMSVYNYIQKYNDIVKQKGDNNSIHNKIADFQNIPNNQKVIDLINNNPNYKVQDAKYDDISQDGSHRQSWIGKFPKPVGTPQQPLIKKNTASVVVPQQTPDSMGIVQPNLPQTNLGAIPNLPYRVEYDGTQHKFFEDDKAGEQFMQELQARPQGIPYGVKGYYPQKKKGGWISTAINPDHAGFCSPITKSTCTPHRKAFAIRAKKGFK